MNLFLNEKLVLVTGASAGIGAKIAEKFLEEGAKVILVSRGSTKLFDLRDNLREKYDPNKIFLEICDFSDRSKVKKLHVKVKKKYGKIDILICNVGDGRSVEDAIPSEKQWDKIWSINFDSSVNATRYFLEDLKATKGCILFISSIAGVEAFGAPTDYSTAKTAIISFSKNIAKKLAPLIRVNVIAPGNVIFDGGNWDKKFRKEPKKIEELIFNTVPMQRFGNPEDIANAAVFICSERASFITGSTLVIDGGQSNNV